MKQIAHKFSVIIPVPAQLFCLGCLSALATAPLYLWPLMIVGYSSLCVRLIKSQTPITSAFYGFVFFLGFFTTSLYWISNSLFVDLDQWWWALPLSLFGLPALLALFPSTCFYIVAFITRNFHGFYKWRWVGYVAAFIISDIARANLFTGFPWNMPIHIMAHENITRDTLPHIGFYGFNTLIITLFCMPALFLRKNYRFITIFVLIFGLWTHNLYTKKPLHASVGHDMHLIQLNIAQNKKWNRDLMWDHFMDYIHHSEQTTHNATTPQLVIWPETALSYDFINHKIPRQILLDFLKTLPDQSFLITGTLIIKNGQPTNSIVVLNKDGNIIAQYNKHHLVPFGEYMPFGLETFTKFHNFTTGPKPKSLNINENLSFLPLICYEIIFPHYSYAANDNDAFILNITNDAWFGHSAGPFQHFDHAVLRAIENQKTVIRLSGNGISGIITTNGHILTHSNLNLKDTLSFKKKNL